MSDESTRHEEKVSREVHIHSVRASEVGGDSESFYCRIDADYERIGKGDRWYLPDVYWVEVGAGNVIKQSPIEKMRNESGTWSMGFVDLEIVGELPAEFIVHMDEASDRFEVTVDDC